MVIKDLVIIMDKALTHLELMIMKEVDFKEQIIVQETIDIIQDVVIQVTVIQDIVIQDIVIHIEVELALIHIYKKKLYIIL